MEQNNNINLETVVNRLSGISDLKSASYLLSFELESERNNKKNSNCSSCLRKFPTNNKITFPCK